MSRYLKNYLKYKLANFYNVKVFKVLRADLSCKKLSGLRLTF